MLLSDEDKVETLGLSERQKGVLMQGIIENNGTEQTIIELNNLGFSSRITEDIFSRYQEKSLEVIRKDPYSLATEIRGSDLSASTGLRKEWGFHLMIKSESLVPF